MTPRNLIQHRGGRETGGVFLVLLVVALILGGLAVTAVVLLSDHSGKETDAVLSLGSADGAVAWVNGGR